MGVSPYSGQSARPPSTALGAKSVVSLVFVLILILLRRELGGLQWSRVIDALWLRPPRDPNTGQVGGRVWWWVLLLSRPFYPLERGGSVDPNRALARDLPDFLDSDRAEDFFSGAWGWFAGSSCFSSSTPCSARSSSSGGD